MATKTGETTSFNEMELTSFALNALKLDSIAYKAAMELSGDNPDPRRLGIWTAEVKSLDSEIRQQIKRAVEAGGDQIPIVLAVIETCDRAQEMIAEGVKKQREARATQSSPPNGPVDNPPLTVDDGSMEPRITALEKDMATVKTDVAVIRSNYVTKEDLHKELHAMTWKIFGFAGLLTAAVYFIAKHVP